MNDENKAILEKLKHIFVTVCLEPDREPETTEQAFLWTHRNFSNRWWLSSLQLVVYNNGQSCAIGNFSTYLDGNVMMRGTAEIQKRAAHYSLNLNSLAENEIFRTEKLEWQVPQKLFRLAERGLEQIKDIDQPATFVIDPLGSQFFKEHGLTGIPVFVIALQMTLKQLLNKQVAIHQFVSLAHYRYMDLTTAVVSTDAVKHFVEQFLEAESFNQHSYQLFVQAIQSQKEVIKKVREKLGLADILTLFFLNSSKTRKIWAQTLIFPMLRLFRKLHLITMEPRQVLISHPAIYPEIPLVGRPGVRLPYVSYFGLHYQIWPDRIVFTFMPGVKWEIPNKTVVSYLEVNLLKLKKMIEQAGKTDV